MKEYFKNFNFKKLCSLVTAVVFVALLIVMAIGGRHRVITALRNADGKTVIEVKDDIDSTYNDGVYHKYSYVNLCGLSAKLMGMNELNNTMKLKDGSLNDMPGDAEYNDDCAIKLNEFKEYLDGKNIEHLYVQVPTNGGETSGLLPNGIDDCGDMLYSSLNRSLDEKDINNIDVLEIIENESEDGSRSGAFFTTDHHWRISTAFSCYKHIVGYFNENFDAGIDEKYIDDNNFETEIYEELFLGSYGRRTGIYYAGIDDFELITPKADIDSEITFEVPSKNLVRNGNFEEALLDKTFIERGNYFEKSPYNVYLGGDFPFAKMTNHGAPCDNKLLVLTDSMGYPVLPFMSLAFKEIQFVDLRYYHDKAFVDVIEEYDPDTVVFIYRMSRLFDKVSFEFFNKTGETEIVM